MASATNAVVDQRHTFATHRHQPVKMAEDRHGNFLPKLSDFRISFRRCRNGLQLQLLQGKQVFHSRSHARSFANFVPTGDPNHLVITY
jgi:hypothetical protein